MDNILEVRKLSKSYGDKKAVENISFEIHKGDIFAFIGPNGAGKSTTIRSVVGSLEFDKGDVVICGHSVKDEPIECKKNLAYIPDTPDIYEHLTGIQYLSFIADAFRISNIERKNKIREYADRFEMSNALGNLISSYSHGMKQKISIIAAMIHSPKLMVLDEPFVGLDPVVRDEILDIFLEFIQDEEHSILFSTHITSDIQKVADYVILIHNGKIIFEEKKDDLIYNYGIIRCKKSEFNTVSPDDYVCCRETNLSVECLIHDKVAAKKRYQNLIIDNASIEDIMLFY